jgi:gluconate 2-dehydrogenase gamma chain
MSKDGEKMAGVSRREMLLQSGIAVGAIALPAASVLQPAEAAQETAELVGEGELRTFTRLEYETLDAICSRIIPTDESGPGAREAKAARYIDWGLSGTLNTPAAGGRGGRGAPGVGAATAQTPREQYTSALAAVEAHAMSSKGASFSTLPPTDQDAIITLLQNSQLPGAPTGFFNTIRMHTIQGTFSDPFYGGNYNCVGWDLIRYPGVRTTVPAEYQQWGTALEPNHQSAYDHDMFDKGVL